MRICSLLPSATEMVFNLGLGDHLVAVTHECDYPAEAVGLPVITRSAIDNASSSSRDIHNHVSQSVHSGSSIYQLDHDLLKKLDPDIILTQELCEVCAVSYGDVESAVRLVQGDPQIVSLEPTSLGGILESIERLGQIADVAERAAELVEQLRRRSDHVASVARASEARPRVLSLEWLDPPFVGGHWVPEMVRLAGGSDGLTSEGTPSREVTWDVVTRYDPEVLVLMPCGFELERTIEELRQAYIPDEWSRLSAVQSSKVYAVDGSAYFSRPGPRIFDGLEVLAEIIHPELFPRKSPPDACRRVFAGGP